MLNTYLTSYGKVSVFGKMMEKQSIKFSWLNMASQIGKYRETSNEKGTTKDWSVYILYENNLYYITAHRGWNSYYFEIFLVSKESLEKTLSMEWSGLEDTEDLPDNLIDFMVDTLSKGKWYNDIPDSWNYDEDTEELLRRMSGE